MILCLLAGTFQLSDLCNFHQTGNIQVRKTGKLFSYSSLDHHGNTVNERYVNYHLKSWKGDIIMEAGETANSVELSFLSSLDVQDVPVFE